MKCSCKTYERYGYPCHHILHVCDCNSIHSIQREWIDIRWTKNYLLKYLHHDTDDKTNQIYSNIKSNFPCGIKFVSSIHASYPVYKGFQMNKIDDSIFNVPSFQFLSRKTMSLWIEQNRTDDSQINQLLSQKDTEFVSQKVHLSQQQQVATGSQQLLASTSDDDDNCSFTDNNDEMSYSSDNYLPTHDEVCDYTENLALFKRAFQLSGNNLNKHKELYTMLSNFVITNEINHNDNETVMNNREKGEKILVSSNKITNTTRKSTKRRKSCWEI